MQCIESVCCVSWPCFVVGDFNAPAIDWSHLSVSSSGADIHLLNFAIDNGFTQIVNYATRKRSILDLVLTNEPNTVFDVVVGHPFGVSDHCSVSILQLYLNRNSQLICHVLKVPMNILLR